MRPTHREPASSLVAVEPTASCLAASDAIAPHAAPFEDVSATPQVAPVPTANTPRLPAASRRTVLDAERNGPCSDPESATRPRRRRTTPGTEWSRVFAWRGRRGWGARLASALPTPARTPFTFCYAVVLLATGLFILWGDPGAVHGALEGSSSDASNLAHRPLFALVTSGIWVAGGLTSPSIALFPFVLGALERRVGAWRTAAVFALGHVLATLFTELPVAAAVASGHLPPSSLDRLDYGISYGLLASLAALAGLLVRKVRWAVLVSLGAVLALDLIELADPLTNWGHVLAVLIGLACWSPLRSGSTRHPEQR
nr:rhomboid-like protein [Streptomyces buecherae]